MNLKSKVLLACVLGILASTAMGVNAMVTDDTGVTGSSEGSWGSESSCSTPSVTYSGPCSPVNPNLPSPDTECWLAPENAISPSPFKFEKKFPIEELKCKDFDDLIAKLRDVQRSWGKKQIIDGANSRYYYWVNTELPQAGVHHCNVWFGDNLLLEECKEDGCVALLPSYGCFRHQGYRYAVDNSINFREAILNAGNWKLIGGGVQGSDSGLDLIPWGRYKDLGSYIKYLDSFEPV